MRLSNKSKEPIYNFIFSVLLMSLLIGVVLFIVERYRLDFLGNESYLLLIIPIVILILFHFRGKQIFEYDSDGEALNFKNRNVITFLDKVVSNEFPKYKLLNYEVVNALLFKRLYITISSKKSNSVILRYDISYLTNKEIKDLKFSLNKVLKANKESKIVENQI